jgi:hypothetical protein
MDVSIKPSTIALSVAKQKLLCLTKGVQTLQKEGVCTSATLSRRLF